MIEREFPAFSVLMSVYKDEKPAFLDEALSSIENQTVIPDEIVVVEDGKLTTELEEVLLDHQQRFSGIFKIIRKEKNEGLGLALRTGMKSVSTNWIARMDTDDISVPNRFELQLSEIIQDKKIAVIGGQIDEFENGVNDVVGSRDVPCSYSEIRDFIKWRNPFNHPTVMFNKKAVENVGGYTKCHLLEDYNLWARLVVNGYYLKNSTEILVHMRVGNGLYKRRGDIKSLQDLYRLRFYLYRNNIITKCEQIIGDVIASMNVLLPEFLRKIIYKKILHKNRLMK
ncbi:glycosyltransferase [Limosilactobacillus ingluviei]